MQQFGRAERQRGVLQAYGIAAIVSGIALILTLAYAPMFQYTRFAFFFGAVVINAYIFGIGPALLTIAVAIVSVTFFVLPPTGSLQIDGNVLVTVGPFSLLAILTSVLAQLRRNAEARAHHAATQIAFLQHITAAFSAARTPEDIASVLVEESLAPLGATLGSLRMLSPDGTLLTALYTSNPDHQAQWGVIPLARRLPLTDAVRTGVPVWITSRSDARARYPDLEPIMEAYGHGSSASLPIVVDGTVIGGMVFNYVRARPFAEGEQSLLRTIAAQCAQALQRAELFTAERTAREAAEVSRAATEAALAHRDHFLSMAAHELRTPLTSLFGNAQLLQRRLSRDERTSPRDLRATQVIVDQAARLTTLISALLDISRLELGQLQITRRPLDVCALLRRTIDELRASLGDRPVDLDCPDGPVALVGDSLRLEQAFANLIQNACKYSPTAAPVHVALAVDEHAAVVTVTDHGVGIAADQIPHLFERYYRAGNADLDEIGGMGIGLYVVKEVVARHGGRVEVESQLGSGSVFTVILPRGLAPEPAAAVADAA